jgi:PAS domain S-box-containing protein
MTLDAKAPHANPERVAQHWEGEVARHQEVHDRSPDGLMFFRAVRDSLGQIVDFEWLYSNSSASKIVGRRSEDLLGKHLLVEMPGNKQAGLFDIYVRVVELGEPHSHEFPYRHEGLDNWFRATSIKQGDGFYVAFTDLTVRKRAEVQAARLAAIVRSSEHAFYSTSETCVVETWSKGAEKLYGHTSAEMVGHSIWVTIPEQCWPEHEEALRRVLTGGTLESFQTKCLTKAGPVVHVSIMFSPISDLDDRTVGIAIVAQDISRQVDLQEQLAVANRLASIGTLAAGVAHEISEPLADVSAKLAMMIEEVRTISRGSPSGRLDELEGMALKAQAGAEQVRELLRELMTFPSAVEEPLAMAEQPMLEASVSMAMDQISQRALAAKGRADSAPAGGYVLVIAGDAMTRSALQRALGQQYFLTCPRTSAEALALIEAGMRFDLILCDLAMPGLSATAFHSELARQYPDQARRIVLLTGGPSTPEIIELMQASSNPRLARSFEPRHLCAVVGGLLLELGILDRADW